MGRVTEALRALCTTLSVPATGDNKAELIESIADNYSGGGGGGITVYGVTVANSNVTFYDISGETPYPVSAQNMYTRVMSKGAENVVFLRMFEDETMLYYRCNQDKGDNGFIFFTTYETEIQGSYSYCNSKIQLTSGGAYFNEYKVSTIPIS